MSVFALFVQWLFADIRPQLARCFSASLGPGHGNVHDLVICYDVTANII